MQNNKTLGALLVLLLVVSGFNAYETYTMHKTISEKVIVLNNKIDAATISTDGKLQALEKKSAAQEEKLASIKNTTVVQQQIRYVEKTSPDDADVELKNIKPKVTIKVNDGPKYNFDLLPDENQKFENGKLELVTASTLDLNITQDEYAKSKWNITTAMNADKKVLGGVSYSLGHSVSANLFFGQGIKPYYGFTWSVGNRTK